MQFSVTYMESIRSVDAHRNIRKYLKDLNVYIVAQQRSQIYIVIIHMQWLYCTQSRQGLGYNFPSMLLLSCEIHFHFHLGSLQCSTIKQNSTIDINHKMLFLIIWQLRKMLMFLSGGSFNHKWETWNVDAFYEVCCCCSGVLSLRLCPTNMRPR